MNTYLIGFGIKQGEFVNSDKQTVTYSNRLLRFATDNGKDDLNFGFSGFEVKVKTLDIAKTLGIAEKDDVVDAALKNLYKKQVELVYVPRNNELSVVGIRPVYTTK